MEQDERHVAPEEKLAARQRALQRYTAGAVEQREERRARHRDPGRRGRQMTAEQRVLQEIEDEQRRQVGERSIGFERLLAPDRVHGSGHAEDDELRGLEHERRNPVVRRVGTRNDIEADEPEIQREEVDQAPAMPDREYAEHRAPGGEVDHEVRNGAAQAREQEWRGIGAGDREERIQVALEHPAEPQRREAYADHGCGRERGVDETVIVMRAVGGKEKDRDAAGRQEAGVLAVETSQPEARADQQESGDGRERHLPHRRQPAAVDAEPDQIGGRKYQSGGSAPAEDARDERRSAFDRRGRRRRRAARDQQRLGRQCAGREARFDSSEALFHCGEALVEFR